MPAVPIITGLAGAAGIYNAVSGARDSSRVADAAIANANAAASGAPQAQGPYSSTPVTYDLATQYFRDNVYRGGAAPYSNEWNDAFNEWFGPILAQNNANTFGDLTYGQLTGQTGANSIIPSSVAGPGGTVDLAAAQAAAQAIAQQNAANAAALERQLNPGAAELRSAGLQAVLDRLNQPQQGIVGELPTSGMNDELLARLASEAAAPISGIGYDSPLTRAAVQRAGEDLALGGILPQDVAQLVARRAYARAGTTGSLGLGRDISARDLGLTSLDLRNQRLANALAAGGAEVGLEQGNAAMRLSAEQLRRQGLLAAQGATAADLARRENAYFNQNSLAQQIQSGDFARALAAAQLGQNIAMPQSGLDPGAVVNLAVGNVNQASNAQQQANALAAQAAQQRTALGGQLIGTALGMGQNYYRPAASAPAYVPPTATSVLAPRVFGSIPGGP